MQFEEELKRKIDRAEIIVHEYMPMSATFQKTVTDAMSYTVSAGGKRIRPVLMAETFRMFGGRSNIVEPFMAAIEMIHTYSLIHDDLPALDNDDYRRGRKTAHVVYGEAMAILAGDGLLNYAYETAAKAFRMIPESGAKADIAELERELAERKAVERALTVLAFKPGIYGMIGGQTADVELTGQTLSSNQLMYIYENKTGALIEASMMIGAILAGADEDQVRQIECVAGSVGMAYQIRDDILDETASFEKLGKPIHSDRDSGKVTHVTIYGMDESVMRVEALSGQAIEMLSGMNGDSAFLVRLISELTDRDR